MTVPGPIREAVGAALEERLGRAINVLDSTPVGGGCISPTARLRTDAGLFFLKWGDGRLPDSLLTAEARGLRRLAAADAVRTPEVVAVAAEHEPAWLLLEWLEPAAPSEEGWERLGRELADLHRSRADRFGADAANFIGSLPQENSWSASWPAFWRDRRLEPQLRRARDEGLLTGDDRDRFDLLFRALPELLAAAAEDGPSLLHGDLWNGNVHFTEARTPALIDPSVYYGHREVDLAMAALFGGFGGSFDAAYRKSWALEPGHERRQPVYQLYYLLVHVNLFGHSYVARTRSALAEAGF